LPGHLFLDATAWGKTAEVMSQYLKKGDLVHISGRLQSEFWEDKQTNQKKSKLNVVIENFQFLGGKGEKQEGAREPSPAPAEKPETDDDDPPF